jgi:hypothetical protein
MCVSVCLCVSVCMCVLLGIKPRALLGIPYTFLTGLSHMQVHGFLVVCFAFGGTGI